MTTERQRRIAFAAPQSASSNRVSPSHELSSPVGSRACGARSGIAVHVAAGASRGDRRARLGRDERSRHHHGRPRQCGIDRRRFDRVRPVLHDRRLRDRDVAGARHTDPAGLRRRRSGRLPPLLDSRCLRGDRARAAADGPDVLRPAVSGGLGRGPDSRGADRAPTRGLCCGAPCRCCCSWRSGTTCRA